MAEAFGPSRVGPKNWTTQAELAGFVPLAGEA
jgi:hypothetical protein